MHHRRLLRSALSLLLLSGLTATMGCKPKAVRGGPGTANPNLDKGAMSTTLDREDIKYLVQELRLFSTVTTQVLADGDKCRIVFFVTENPRIGTLTIFGNSEYSRDEVLEVIQTGGAGNRGENASGLRLVACPTCHTVGIIRRVSYR